MYASSGTVVPFERATCPVQCSPSPAALDVMLTKPSITPPVALPYATVGERASCALQSLSVLKTVRMPGGGYW
jgi:hypothetical protein